MKLYSILMSMNGVSEFAKLANDPIVAIGSNPTSEVITQFSEPPFAENVPWDHPLANEPWLHALYGHTPESTLPPFAYHMHDSEITESKVSQVLGDPLSQLRKLSDSADALMEMFKGPIIEQMGEVERIFQGQVAIMASCSPYQFTARLSGLLCLAKAYNLYAQQSAQIAIAAESMKLAIEHEQTNGIGRPVIINLGSDMAGLQSGELGVMAGFASFIGQTTANVIEAMLPESDIQPAVVRVRRALDDEFNQVADVLVRESGKTRGTVPRKGPFKPLADFLKANAKYMSRASMSGFFAYPFVDESGKATAYIISNLPASHRGSVLRARNADLIKSLLHNIEDSMHPLPEKPYFPLLTNGTDFAFGHYSSSLAQSDFDQPFELATGVMLRKVCGNLPMLINNPAEFEGLVYSFDKTKAPSTYGSISPYAKSVIMYSSQLTAIQNAHFTKLTVVTPMAMQSSDDDGGSTLKIHPYGEIVPGEYSFSGVGVTLKGGSTLRHATPLWFTSYGYPEDLVEEKPRVYYKGEEVDGHEFLPGATMQAIEAMSKFDTVEFAAQLYIFLRSESPESQLFQYRHGRVGWGTYVGPAVIAKLPHTWVASTLGSCINQYYETFLPEVVKGGFFADPDEIYFLRSGKCQRSRNKSEDAGISLATPAGRLETLHDWMQSAYLQIAGRAEEQRVSIFTTEQLTGIMLANCAD